VTTPTPVPRPTLSFGPRRLVGLLVAVSAFYLVLIADRGLLLVRDGRPVAVLLGIGVLLLPVVGTVVLWREVRFGRDAQRLTRLLEERGRLPDALGRDVDHAVADAVFARRRTEVEEAPDDWVAWARLSLAYADARDLPRARRAMRHAVTLETRARPSGEPG
jgi:cytochrome c-type biogenesis protein CcmH/NrfG